MGTWRLLDHPADLALEGRGNSAAAAVDAVLEGLLVQVLGEARPDDGTEETLTIEGLDQPECLVSTFNEILYRINAKGISFSSCHVLELGDTRLVLRASSKPRSPECAVEQEIKAATYHGLHLAPDPGGTWILRVVFDV